MDENLDTVDNETGEDQTGEDQAGYIAVIGMAGRFPKADDIDTFWQNLIDGVECVSFFTPEELAEAGVDPTVSAMPNFVNARAIVNEPEMFDNRFFGMPPREAELTDPQHRLFLETCQTALETAGCDPERYEGYIGVYAGADVNSYAMGNLAMAASNTMALLGNDKDYLATRVSFKLNLRGPGITVQTACSTSLVTVHMACQGLLDFHCDIALAGGVGINFPQKSGYIHTEGAVLSPDGHCRAFDAKAKGTPPGDGVGVVVLKRLEEALEDGDVIHGVIRGSAINNDGGMKVGFTAPSIDGQAEVIAMAQETAGVTPEDIGYVEAHGTGTELGDPIEMTALTEAFQAGTDKQGYCAVGSLKTNMGHMNSASGIGGLIKTVLAVKHGKIPPSLNFTEPNPKLNIEESPFFINTALRDWTPDTGARIAGVSSFGAGGTNAHAIVEEPPVQDASSDSRGDQFLVISAKTATALDTATDNLAAWLRANPAESLADTAYTLQTGRQLFDHRRFLVSTDTDAAAAALESREGLTTATATPGHAPVVFMFPGQGAQYVTMGKSLYEEEPLFREIFDQCADILQPLLNLDLREALYPGETSEEKEKGLQSTSLAQPAIFVIEYAMARLWMSWGVTPEAMIGHSIGELTAACLAGVFSLEDALNLVHKRADLMQAMPPGEMVTVSLSEADARMYEGVSVAAVNAPNRCVLSGDFEAMAKVKTRLKENKVAHASLHTSHAFHSEMMAPAMDAFHRAFEGIQLNPPEIPYISNVTGTWITSEDAVSPEYWAKHIISAVRFGQGAVELLDDPARIFLEAGPGQTLTTLVRANAEKGSNRKIFKSLRHPKDKVSDTHLMLETLGSLYCANVAVDWAGFYENETRRKVSLPTYPFERERFWSDPGEKIRASMGKPEGHLEAKIPDVGQWLYCQSWKRTAPAQVLPAEALKNRRCMVLGTDNSAAQAVIGALTSRVGDVVLVTPGNEFYKLDDNRYSANPEDRKSFEALFAELAEAERMPDQIIHLWDLADDNSGTANGEPYTGFLSLMALAGALSKTSRETPVRLDVITTGTADVLGDEPIAPEKTMILS
ncbi:MAG: type I polyketide synthase, partial [Desulfobacterales bacterium]|nr:type I polyketide synthase [Desulfobacterales bacterium]